MKTTRKSPQRGKAAVGSWEVGFIGGGNMATALIRGLIATGTYKAEKILVSDIETAKLTQLRKSFKVTTTRDNEALVRDAKVVVLAIKPQIVDGVLTEIRPAASDKNLFLSIVAGVTTRRLEAGLGGTARVLRAMPNTPALLGKGMSVVARGKYATAADERLGLKLLHSVGEAVAAQDERILDAVTGLSGSGPAYVYLFAESLIAGGVAAGLTAAMAAQLAFQTIAGAAAMLQEAGQSPETLRAQVTSPNGTTFAGLGELNRRGFKDAVISAVVAATRRSEELGRG